MVALTVACSGARSTKVESEITLEDYSMLQDDDLSLTFRDDGDTESSPSDDALLRARNAGNFVLDFRRGSRWADGQTQGKVGFALTDRISIVSWQLGESSGSGQYPLAMNSPEAGDEISADGWSCTVSIPDLIETYYGDFTDVMTISCTGDSGPAGDWHFAKDVGLIAYDGDSYQLDLVAPW